MNPRQQEAERLEVKVEDGKYTVIQESNGNFYALRYDQPWRTLVGDNLVLALAQDLLTARDELVEWKKAAFACGLYRADTAHETPALWEKAQTDAAIALLNARDELDYLKRNTVDVKVYNDRVRIADQCAKERNQLRAKLSLKDEMLSKQIIDMDLVMENTKLKAELEQRDKVIIDSANAADASEQSRNKAIAKVEELRAELEQCRKWLSERPSDTLYQNRVDEVTALKAELERVKGIPPHQTKEFKLEQELSELRDQLAALMDDKERMNKLQEWANSYIVTFSVYSNKRMDLTVKHPTDGLPIHRSINAAKDLRDAVDSITDWEKRREGLNDN